MNEEIKKEMAERLKTDHLEISSGSAAKGTNVTLKAYFDVADIDDTQKRVENILKIKTYLMKMGIM